MSEKPDTTNRYGLPTEITCTNYGISCGLYDIEYAYSLERDIPIMTAHWCMGSGEYMTFSNGHKEEIVTPVCTVILIYDKLGGAHIGGHPCPQVDVIARHAIPFLTKFLKERGAELQAILAKSEQFYSGVNPQMRRACRLKP